MSQLFAILLLLPNGQPNQWPGFLGAGATTVNPSSIPTVWSTEKNRAWTKVTPGYGQSSPIIWKNHVIVTAVDGESKQKLQVLCYDLKSGASQWIETAESTHPEKNSVYISRAAPTPLADSNAVFAYFESGDILAVAHTGKRLWHRSLSEDYGPPTNRFGLSASPVQLDDRIVILIDDPKSAYLIAISKSNGKTIWKTDREPRTSWSSPALVDVDGRQQIVCSSAGSIDGYDPETGMKLWSFDQVGGNTGTTPTMVSAGSFLIGASPGRQGENAQMANKSNGMFTVSKTPKGWNTAYAWTNPDPKPSWASPVAHAGFAYWVNRAGVVYCIDLSNGKTVYAKRLKQSAWTTPVALGDRIFVFGKSGLTTVLAAGKEFKILAENELWNEDAAPVNNIPTAEETTAERRRAVGLFSKPTVYGAALVDNHIVLRTGSQLFCIRKTESD